MKCGRTWRDSRLSSRGDSTFLYTEPHSVVGFWFAIEDAHCANGCLDGLPGEHKKGLREIYRKHDDCLLKLDLLRPDLSWDMNLLEWLEVKKARSSFSMASFRTFPRPIARAHRDTPIPCTQSMAQPIIRRATGYSDPSRSTCRLPVFVYNGCTRVLISPLSASRRNSSPSRSLSAIARRQYFSRASPSCSKRLKSLRSGNFR